MSPTGKVMMVHMGRVGELQLPEGSEGFAAPQGQLSSTALQADAAAAQRTADLRASIGELQEQQEQLKRDVDCARAERTNPAAEVESLESEIAELTAHLKELAAAAQSDAALARAERMELCIETERLEAEMRRVGHDSGSTRLPVPVL